jgi:hypothetical protein
MIVIHYGNVRMHNIPKVDELKVDRDDTFLYLFIRSVMKKITTMTLNNILH